MDDALERRPVLTRLEPQDAVVGDRLLPRGRRHHRHLLAVHGVASDVRHDRALVRGGDSLGDGEILLLRLAAGELGDKGLIGGLALRRDQTPRGLLVEAMDDSGTVLAGEGAEFSLTMMQQRVDERAVGIAGRGVDDEPRGLVHDDEIVVLEEDGERDLLAEQPGGALRLDPDKHLVPGGDGVARLHGPAADGRGARLDELLDRGPRKILARGRERRRQPPVEPLARGRGRHDETVLPR